MNGSREVNRIRDRVERIRDWNGFLRRTTLSA